MLLLQALLPSPAPPPPPEERLPPPGWAGDPEGPERLGEALREALEATLALGPGSAAPWTIRLHLDDAGFEAATGAPPARAAAWVGSVLHLRPWSRLRQRGPGTLLRHELAHRRLAGRGLRRWEEEARCLWAETRRKPLEAPPAPAAELQDRLDLALERGGTAAQAWAYAWLRAWLKREPPPSAPPRAPGQEPGAWVPEEPGAWVPKETGTRTLQVRWPQERLPRVLEIDGRAYAWRPGSKYSFRNPVRFGPGAPLNRLEGRVDLEGSPQGWVLTWTTDAATWAAAAVDGELGEAPFEARRALAAVLLRWLKGHPEGRHPDGSLCPLTHCAVVRGYPGAEARRAVAQAPALPIDPRWAFFTGSAGGHPLSPREVWGSGPDQAGPGIPVPGDPWATWTRRLDAAKVRALKAAVRPGLAPGQRGLKLGRSGPYPVERLRLEAGRRFGWTLWPSNACTARDLPGGAVELAGWGWGHNAGLCLSGARQLASEGWSAERILEQAFPEGWKPTSTPPRP